MINKIYEYNSKKDLNLSKNHSEINAICVSYSN